MSSATETLALADEAVLALAGLGGRATPAQHDGGRRAEGLAELTLALAAVPDDDLARRALSPPWRYCSPTSASR